MGQYRTHVFVCTSGETCPTQGNVEQFVKHLRAEAARAGLKDDDIVIRMTGCPNGCARPSLAEIGLVGRNPGLYNLYLGAAFDGTRLNKLYAEDVDKARIMRLLEPMFVRYAKEREEGEHFGD